MNRSRALFLALAAATVVLGLASRRFGGVLPPFVAAYAGDALWAAMVYLLAAAAWNRAPVRHLAIGTGVFALAIELSQLYRAPWIDALRATRPGALVLGHGFLWSDLACYAAGIGIAVAVDAGLRRRARGSADGAFA